MNTAAFHKSTLENTLVTSYSDVYATIGQHITFSECLKRIRSDHNIANTVGALRRLYWKAEESRYSFEKGKDTEEFYKHALNAYETAKKERLPAFTFSGTFKKRNSASLETYSGLLQVDLDHLFAKGIAFGHLKKRLQIDPHVAFCFLSPSGDGLKIGLRVETGPEDHLKAFLAIQRYFVATYGIRPDDACKDVSRLCFFSSDREIWINPAPASFDWCAWPEPKDEIIEEDIDTAVPLPLDAFPILMQELAKSCAEVFQIDVALPAVSALAVMAAALGNSVTCEGALNGHTTPCNLFTVCSAPSGYGKGVVRKVSKPLTDASGEMAKHFKEAERPQLIADIAIGEGKKKVLLGKLKDNKTTVEGEAEIRTQIGRLEADVQKWTFEANQSPVYYIGSATGAALGLTLMRNREQVFQLAFEAGDSIRVAAGRFTSDNRGDYDLYLSGYTGEPFSDARISRESIMLNAPCLNVLWTVQPTLLRELYGNPEAQERGVLARFNVVECSDDIIPLDDGAPREVPSYLEHQWDKLVRAALELPKAGRNVTFIADDDAREVFRIFHNEAVAILNDKGRENQAKWKRCRENAIRNALVIAATEWLVAGAVSNTPTLTKDHAARGVVLAQYFMYNTLKLTKAATVEAQKTRFSQLEEIVKQAGGSITLRQLRDHHGFGESELNQIVGRNENVFKLETAISGPKGGRPSPRLVAIHGR